MQLKLTLNITYQKDKNSEIYYTDKTVETSMLNKTLWVEVYVSDKQSGEWHSNIQYK